MGKTTETHTDEEQISSRDPVTLGQKINLSQNSPIIGRGITNVVKVMSRTPKDS